MEKKKVSPNCFPLLKIVGYLPVFGPILHATLGNHLHVLLGLLPYGGEEITRNSAIDATVNSTPLYLWAELSSATGEAEVGTWVHKAKEGDARQYFFFA